MKLNVNGQEMWVSDVSTVADLLKSLSIVPETVVCEHNLNLIKRKDFHTAVVNEGDQIEIIQMIGGG